MRLSNAAPAPSLRRLPALLLIVLAALAVSLSGGSPANAADAPSVTGVDVTSDAGDDDTYALGETITITVTFSEAVNVTGTPQLKIDMDPADWGTKIVDYAGGSGTASLTFDHTVVEPNYSTQGIAVLANSLALNGGTIRSASGVNAALTHDGRDHDPEHKVDWRVSPPALTVTGVEVTSAPASGDTYALGETIAVTLAFSEAVNVTGTPQINIDMDPADWGTKVVDYAGGSGTAGLRFDHTVVEPNLSRQGIAVLANSLALNGGTIRSASHQTDADLSHTGRGHDAGHKVDWRLAPSAPACGDAPPENVVAIRGDSGIVVSWTTPDAVGQCDLTGFLVTVEWSGDGLSASSHLTALPTDTTVTVQDLGLADYEVTVYAQYEARPRTLHHHVPAFCAIQLTVVSDFDNGVSGSWTSASNACDTSFRVQHKKPARTAWDTSDYFSVNRRAFKYGDLDPVTYEFRVQTKDEHGVIHNSDSAELLVRQDASETFTSRLARPQNVRAEIHPMEHGLIVWWDDPLGVPTGKTVSGFYVEYQLASASPTSAWTRARRELVNDTRAPFVRLSPSTELLPADFNRLAPQRVVVAVPDDPSTPADETVAAVNHGVAGLAKDTAYRVRVLTELTDNNDSTVKTTVASTYTKPVVVRHEAVKAWWIDHTPSYNPNIGRFFAQTDSNHNAASGLCSINGGEFFCPPRTLTSSSETIPAAGGTYTFHGTLTAGSSSGTLSVVIFEFPDGGAPTKNALRFGQVPPQYFVSGSDDTMYVRWQKVERPEGQFESYLIETRKADGDWVTTVVDKNKADARHGMSDWIDYELSKDELNNCHSELDETALAACQAESASGEYEVRIRVRTVVGSGASQRNVDGPSEVVSTTVGGGRSGAITDERIDHIGAGKLRVSWEAPETLPDNVYGYRVRWLEKTPGATWQTRDIFPRKYLRSCSFVSCSNPRSVDLTGLQSGKRYYITVAVADADGWGDDVVIAWGAAPD